MYYGFTSPVSNIYYFDTGLIKVITARTGGGNIYPNGDILIVRTGGKDRLTTAAGNTSWLRADLIGGIGYYAVQLVAADVDSYNAYIAGTATSYIYTVCDTVNVNVVARPSDPMVSISSPAAGASSYINADLGVTWRLNLNTSMYPGIASSGCEIAVFDPGKTDVAKYSALPDDAGATSATIPGGAIILPAGIRSAYYDIRVRVNATNCWLNWSQPVQILYKSTCPDKPVPTSPVNGATAYPKSTVTVAFAYTAHGGYALKTVLYRWRYRGGSWQQLSFSTSTPSITIPANTYNIGEIEWQIQAVNTNNESSEWSDTYNLYVVASAPVVPTLTAPSAGSTAYNNAPVKYQWAYNTNVDLPQAGFKLQWRVLGASAWTDVQQSGANTEWTIDHGTAIDGVIEWRVSTYNQFNEWSPWSSVSTYTYTAPRPAAAPVSPLGGYVQPDIAQTFQWAYTSPISLSQAGYELRYKLRGAGAYATVSGGAFDTVLLPANTLPVGTVLWGVRVRDSNNIWSYWSDDIEITTAEIAPNAPTLAEPVGIYLSIADPIRFIWRHNSPIGTPQGAAQLRYRIDAGDWTTIDINGSVQRYDMVAFTVMPGTLTWQVRTYSRNNLPGPWADTATANITGSPVQPSITSATANGARPKVEWIAAGQIIYNLQLHDGSGAVIDDVQRLASGDTGTYIYSGFVPDGIYTMRVRAQNQYGFWSSWAAATVTVSTSAHDAPVLAARAYGYAIRLNADNIDWTECAYALVYRNGVLIARLRGDQYDDYTAAAEKSHAYILRAVFPDNTYADSAEILAKAELPSAYIAPANDPGNGVGIRINMDEPPTASMGSTTEKQLVDLSGRETPVAIYGEHRAGSMAVGLATLRATDFYALYDLMARRVPVIYRDRAGRCGYYCISEILGTDIAYHRGAQTVSIAMDLVDYDNTVSIGE